MPIGKSVRLRIDSRLLPSFDRRFLVTKKKMKDFGNESAWVDRNRLIRNFKQVETNHPAADQDHRHHSSCVCWCARDAGLWPLRKPRNKSPATSSFFPFLSHGLRPQRNEIEEHCRDQYLNRWTNTFTCTAERERETRVKRRTVARSRRILSVGSTRARGFSSAHTHTRGHIFEQTARALPWSCWVSPSPSLFSLSRFLFDPMQPDRGTVVE